MRAPRPATVLAFGLGALIWPAFAVGAWLVTNRPLVHR